MASASERCRNSDNPVLMSACLLGEPCRYDGASAPCEQAVAFSRNHRIVAVCPEQLGGLPTPRTPSEVQADGRVVDASGVDRTANFVEGAHAAALRAHEAGCTLAVLKSRSPSCGVHERYDGTFSGTVVAGEGVTARYLREAGMHVTDEHGIDELLRELGESPGAQVREDV